MGDAASGRRSDSWPAFARFTTIVNIDLIPRHHVPLPPKKYKQTTTRANDFKRLFIKRKKATTLVIFVEVSSYPGV